jgi:hypothetical protein
MYYRSILVTCLGVAAIAASTTAIADDIDDALGGFDEITTPEIQTTEIQAAETTPELTKSGYGELTGSVALSSSYNLDDHASTNGTDWQGLSKLRSRLNLEYNNSLNDKWQMRVAGYTFYDSVYSLRDRDRYSNEVLDDYEYETDFQEVWILGKLRSDLDIKIGRQVVNWGRADSFRVLDVLNPLDNREPGLVDIEDLRLPVTMIKTDYFFTDRAGDGQWQTSFIIIPEIRFSKNPPYGSDFEVLGSNFKDNEPEHFSDSNYAAAITGIYSGWDISFHAARYWRDAPYLNPHFDALNFANPLQGSTLEHSHLTMIGTGGNYTKGAWLVKGELAWTDGVDYTTSTPQNVVVAPGPVFAIVDMPTGTSRNDRLDALIGLEYFGVANSSFSIEIAHQHIRDYDLGMLIGNEKRNRTDLALRATHSMLNDRLDLTAVIFGAFNESGGGERFDAEYDIRDALVLKAGVIFYDKGDDIPFNTYYENDRVFAELKYSF